MLPAEAHHPTARAARGATVGAMTDRTRSTGKPAPHVKRLLFSMAEAAYMLNIGIKTLRGHCLAGEIRFVLTGKRTRKFTVSPQVFTGPPASIQASMPPIRWHTLASPASWEAWTASAERSPKAQ